LEEITIVYILRIIEDALACSAWDQVLILLARELYLDFFQILYYMLTVDFDLIIAKENVMKKTNVLLGALITSLLTLNVHAAPATHNVDMIVNLSAYTGEVPQVVRFGGSGVTGKNCSNFQGIPITWDKVGDKDDRVGHVTVDLQQYKGCQAMINSNTCDNALPEQTSLLTLDYDGKMNSCKVSWSTN
jgi:hypothetical protein